MILIKDRHSLLTGRKLLATTFGKYDTYKGSTLVSIVFRKYSLCFEGNMILIKDRHANEKPSGSVVAPSGKYDTYKGSTREFRTRSK